jgi:tyrosyl-tRNA synthetase
MFGKIMSISDALMWEWYELLTDLTPAEIGSLRSRCAGGEENPRNVKVNLAKSIIEDFHSAQAAAEAEADFNRRFVKKEIPDEIEEKQFAAGSYNLAELLVQTNLVASKGEARRLIEQGGVKINGEKASDAKAAIDLKDEILLQVGKRKFLKVKGS